MKYPTPVKESERSELIEEFTHTAIDRQNDERTFRCCIFVQHMEGMRSYYTAYVQTGLVGELSTEHTPSDLGVHGLTYGIDEDGWVGLDFAHYGDFCVGDKIEESERFNRTEQKNIWSVEDARERIKSLTDELAKKGV